MTYKTRPGHKVKKSYMYLTLKEKLNVIKLYEEGLTIVKIGRSLGITRQSVRAIVNNKKIILSEVKSTAVQSKLIRKKNALIGDMEKQLKLWIEDQICHRIPIRQAIIQTKAITLYNTMKDRGGVAFTSENFGASRSWFHRFKTNANLHSITEHGEVPSTEEAAKIFVEKFAAIIEEEGYSTKQIFNADETALFWKMMPSQTFITKEEKTVPSFKAQKDRLTLLFCTNAAGDCKLKPMLLYHAENLRALKNDLNPNLPVFYKANRKAWMNADMFTTWFSDCFKPQVEKYCREQKIPFKILLLVVNAPNHPTAIDDVCKEIKVLFLPSNITSLLQPMDQGVISTFKSYYTNIFFQKAIATIDTDTSENVHDKLKIYLKGFSILDGIRTISDAWDKVSESILKGIWKKLIPDIGLGLFEDFKELEKSISDIRNEAVTDVVKITNQLELKVGTADVHELLDFHDLPLTDEDILEYDEHLIQYNEQEEQQEDSPASEIMTTKLIEEGLALADKLTEFWDKCDPNWERSHKVCIAIQNGIDCYKELLRNRKKMLIQQELKSYIKTQPLPKSIMHSDSMPVMPSTSVKIEVMEFEMDPYELEREECDPLSIESSTMLVKSELVNESTVTNSWPDDKEETVIYFKEEIKTEGQNYEAELEATCSQIKFEDIELKEEAIELERKINESSLDGIPESTFDKNYIRNSDRRDDVFKEQNGFNSNLESKSFKCITCDRSFCSNQVLKVHMLSVHDRLKPFKCPTCDYSCSEKGALSKHIKSVHEKLKPFKCPTCDCLFARKGFLSRHIKSVHEKLKPYKCPTCDYSFRERCSLSWHIESVHKKLKPFKCPSCDYSFGLKCKLTHHIKSVHEKLKAFKCPWPICDYSCSEKGNLSKHIKAVHEKLKPFKCPWPKCDYSFGYKSSLSIHIKSVHEKLKPFKCATCDYSCGQKGDLSNHIKSVHEKFKPFKCLHCDYSCGRKQYLSKHMALAHKI